MRYRRSADSRRVGLASGLADAPRPAALIAIATDVAAAICAVGALITTSASRSSVLDFLWLLLLCITFEEAARQQAKMRLRLSTAAAQDMTSVWIVAGLIVLPAGLVVVLLVAIRTHKWFRQHRNEGAQLFRKVFATSSVVIACVLGATAMRLVIDDATPVPSPLRHVLAVLAALVVFTVVNHALILAFFVKLMSVAPRAVIGSWEDNLLEFGTLCLGGLVGVVVINEPLFAALVLLPMAVLQRGALVRELEAVASTDSKTGLLNAAAWEQIAHRELSRSERDLSPAAIMIIDLDRFKIVNDTYGHLAGDAALKAVANALTSTLRDYDTIGRFGGEEFIALLPGVSAVEAAVITERTRHRINQLQMSTISPQFAPGSEMMLSASIGVACFPRHGNEVSSLLHAADSALYVAKNSGRNQVCFAGANPKFEKSIEV